VALGAFAGVLLHERLDRIRRGVRHPDRDSHLWTLATEEQFYLLWPPLLALAVYRRLGDKWLVAALGVTALLLATNGLVLAFDGAPVPRVKYAPDATFDLARLHRRHPLRAQLAARP
jgi:peptidoglycan/LPS O-acetylase OafA/YrhL